MTSDNREVARRADILVLAVKPQIFAKVVHDIAADDWSRPYSRLEGCFPQGVSRMDKYWSPVGRVDNVYADRNLICSGPPVEDEAKARA